MGKKEALLVLLIIAVLGKAIGIDEEEKEWWREREEEREEEREFGRKERFLMDDSKQVIRTEAGGMRVVRSPPSRFLDRPMHIGFITMEPKSLFVPQYLDSSLILFVHRGEVKVGLIYKDELAERRMKSGDVYRIPAGSVFYMVNVGEGQRLQIICSIDKSESLSYGTFQSFFIAGGTYPASILAGFDQDTLATAFNLSAMASAMEFHTSSFSPQVSYTELKRIISKQRQGPIVYVDTESPRGSMMAPHMNPTAAEYGIVLKGTGTIQIVYPNGTSAMDAEVTEGDVFWIPRYFPFCQIASRTGPFEFFGFTTSSRRNRPQFLAGASSIFQTLRSLEMATAFDITEDDLSRLIDAQYEAIILPSAEIAPPHKEEEKRRRREEGRRERERESERRAEEAIRSF